jgi:hypothetical protein
MVSGLLFLFWFIKALEGLEVGWKWKSGSDHIM